MTEGTPQDYEAQSDARTLNDAHHVRKDEKRHSKAMKHLKKMGKSSTHAQETHTHETDAVAMLKPGEGYQETTHDDKTGENEIEHEVE